MATYFSSMRALNTNDLAHEYEALVHAFRDYLKKKGVQKKAFSARGLEAFRSFPAKDQIKCTAQLRNFYQICQEAEHAGIDALSDPRGMLRFLTFKMRIAIPDDFINTLTKEDIVEIFDYEGSQVYRNITFFDISDYTVDDFFGQSWDYLYERSRIITRQIFARIDQATQEKKCIPFAVPEHYMRERATENRKIVKVNLKYLAPLWRDGAPVAWIASSTASEVVNKSDLSTESIQFI